MISHHAKVRCQTRGVTQNFLETLLKHADVDRPIGDNCRLLRVSRTSAHKLNVDDRLARYAVIWSDDTSRVVTVMPLRETRGGARYRRM
ncbi:hypothetical protein IQ03_05252 [Gemmobacter caeni]|uniref:DUF4258 domain-containing protein n=1 Tax=Gemmobacter caeni TaxID=589035 RepID=A0A2T6A1Y8_9RHOB|nr:hypothetical protein [Gemmobacter caeni]PTX37851.1 hypothetical protein C8N34_1487 [Gemmobacter caeni]TWI89740.1 hypothetical protein IQ03_05252 [Gemmobacter caeni]